MKCTSNGIPILEFDAIGSTNAEAMRLGLAGAAAPLWVRANRQTAGRGRSGRAWTSEPGNHYASLLLHLTCPQTIIHHLSFVAAVAVVAAIRRVVADFASSGASEIVSKAPSTVPNLWRLRTRRTSSPQGERTNPQAAVGMPSPLGDKVAEGRMRGPSSPQAPLPLRLKWPNDILLDGAKLVGILPESTQRSDRTMLAVIGIGINLAHAPDQLGRATTCLAAHNVSVSPATMLDALAVEMAAKLATWNMGGDFDTIRERWLSDALPMGTAMTINTGSDLVEGKFAGLDYDGALILRDHSGYDRRMTFGDVTVNAAERGRG